MNFRIIVRHIANFTIINILLLISSQGASLVWSENFDTIEPGTAITTTNSSFIGVTPNAGAISTTSSTVGDGTSLQLTAATSGSAAGAWVGVRDLNALSVMTMGFTVEFETLESGFFNFYMGSGNTVVVMSNSNRNSTHFLWDLQVAASASTGTLQYMNASGSHVNTNFTLQAGSTYEFLVQVNATSTEVDSVAANSISVYVNDVLVASGLEYRGGTGNATGFRIGARGASAANEGLVAEVDDIRIWNGIYNASAVPEPTAFFLLLTGFSTLVLRRRRL